MRHRSIFGSAALVLALAVAPMASATSIGQRILMFAKKKGNKPYVAPIISSAFMLSVGDSRTQNGGGAAYALKGVASSSFSSTSVWSNGFAGELCTLANNVCEHAINWNYGVGGQDTAGVLGRFNLQGIDCNDNGTYVSTQVCKYSATTIVANAASAAGSFTVNTTAGNVLITSALIGQYAFSPLVANLPVAKVTAINQAAGTATLDTAFTGTGLSNGGNMVFSPVGNTNPFYNFLGAGVKTNWAETDVTKSTSSANLYSPCSDPGQVITYMAESADRFTTIDQSLSNLAAAMDLAGPSGCNKIVLISDELPRGMAAAIENGTVASTTLTLANHPTYAIQSMYYAPSGTGGVRTAGAPAFTAGASDGVALTQVGSAPAAGQYSIALSTGVVTFNAADNGAKILTYYSYLNTSILATDQRHLTAHDFINNSTQCSGTFTDPNYPGTTYPRSGLACGRPWVVPISTWAAICDTSIAGNCTGAATGSNYYNLPCMDVLTVHPSPRCSRKIDLAFKPSVQTYFGTTPKVALPTLNNISFSGYALDTTASLTTTCSVKRRNEYLQNLVPAVSTGVYGAAGVVAGGPTVYVPTGGALTGVIDCIDTVNNVIHLTGFVETTAGGQAWGSGSGAGFVQFDPGSLIYNGMLDHRLTGGGITNGANADIAPAYTTVCGSSTTTKAVPAGWQFTMSNATDLNSGVGQVAYGIATSPLNASCTGPDAFEIVLQGNFPSGQAITFGAGTTNAVNLAANGLVTPGDIHRAICKVTIRPGPNGLLTGMTGVSVRVSDTSTVSIAAPGDPVAETNYIQFTGQVGGGSVQFTPTDIADNGGQIQDVELSDPTLTAGMTSPTSSIVVGINQDTTNTGPMSATVFIQSCKEGKVTQ